MPLVNAQEVQLYFNNTDIFADNPKDSNSWDIYPAPPKPSYPVQVDDKGNEIPNINEEFDMEKVYIPGSDEHLAMKFTDEGVFQLYTNENIKEHEKHSEEPLLPLVDIPSAKKYFQDQDFILAVVSDGPSKSFAFRRLRYLESKFQMYLMLNEYQEMADSKVFIQV